MHTIGMFDRKGALTTEGFEGSGADWLEQYKKYINDGETVVSNPHKVYGPETNDLVLQLRKRGIDKVILGGMSANLCTESHMRELIEQGFEVAVVSDATAAAIVEEGNGYESALVNFRFIANTVWTTEEAVREDQSSQQVRFLSGHRDIERLNNVPHKDTLHAELISRNFWLRTASLLVMHGTCAGELRGKGGQRARRGVPNRDHR